MRKELREKILAYNKQIAEKKEKAADMDMIIAVFSVLPPGQLKKVFTEDVFAVLEKYGIGMMGGE